MNKLNEIYNKVQAMETVEIRSFLTHSYNDKKENILKVITQDKPKNIRYVRGYKA